jgi:regulator of sirC expression with transglutaminase-like and TPR domain
MTSSPPTTLSSGKLSGSEQTALINLLADDDPAVFQAVRRKILSCGPEAVGWLRTHSISSDPILRRHVLEIISYFERKHADNQFLTFCLKHGEEFDLEKGAWLLAKTVYPSINIDAYQALLDFFAAQLRENVQNESDPDRILEAFNRYIFDELGFNGNVTNYYAPENSYLNRVLDRRTGNPITLSLLYLLLARRLRLPVIGIGLPGHFICRYQSSSMEMYIDPFNRGQLLTKADCIKYLQRGNYSLSDDFLTPVSARRIFMRICSNLHQIYTELGQAEEIARLQHYLVALAR